MDELAQYQEQWKFRDGSGHIRSRKVQWAPTIPVRILKGVPHNHFYFHSAWKQWCSTHSVGQYSKVDDRSYPRLRSSKWGWFRLRNGWCRCWGSRGRAVSCATPSSANVQPVHHPGLYEAKGCRCYPVQGDTLQVVRLLGAGRDRMTHTRCNRCYQDAAYR